MSEPKFVKPYQASSMPDPDKDEKQELCGDFRFHLSDLG
jgi:hypothetical protein